MNNDDKTVVGDSSFGKSNNESNNHGDAKNTFSSGNSSNTNSKNMNNQQVNTKKEDGNVTKRTAAAVGVAAAVGGVAVGTVYSDEIKDTLNGITGNDNIENVEEIAVVSEEVIPQADSQTTSETSHYYVHHIDETTDDAISESSVQEDEMSFEFTDQAGVHGVNFVDFDDDGIADSVELVENGEIVDEYSAEDFQEFLAGGDVLEQEVFSNADDLLDNELAIENIEPMMENPEEFVNDVDYANFDESSISLSESEISNESDFTYEEQSLDYSDEVSVGGEDYMLDTASESDSYLSSNDEYQAELDNTDFDSMDNSDFSNDSYDTDFSGDVI